MKLSFSSLINKNKENYEIFKKVKEMGFNSKDDYLKAKSLRIDSYEEF